MSSIMPKPAASATSVAPLSDKPGDIPANWRIMRFTGPNIEIGLGSSAAWRSSTVEHGCAPQACDSTARLD